MRLQPTKALITLLILFVGCARVPLVQMPTPEQLQAQEQAAEQARMQGEKDAVKLRLLGIRLARELIVKHINALLPLIATLQRWDTLGEKPQDPPDEMTPVVAQLASADELQRECSELPKLQQAFAKLPGAPTPTFDELPPECDLVKRRRAILERQFWPRFNGLWNFRAICLKFPNATRKWAASVGIRFCACSNSNRKWRDAKRG